MAERQKACEEEREFARQRYQKQLERDELEFQQIKRKMMADFNEQVHNLTESAKQDRNSDESRFKTTIEKLRKETEIIQAENLQNIASIRQKHVEEVAKLQESHNLQLQQFQTQFTANQEAIMLSREKKFKEKLIKERDMEIELIINRLESETNSSDSDIQRRHRMEVEKLKSEFANSVCELRDQHSQALDKIVLMQSNLSVAETRFHDLQKQVVGLQIEKQSKENIIMQQRDRIERLNVDEAALSAIIKKEFEEVSATQVKEIQELNVKIETIQSQTQILIRKHEREIHEMTKQKEDTLTMVEEHVKMTLKIKDEAIFALKKQIEELSIKNLHLEKLIDRQRQEILTLG